MATELHSLVVDEVSLCDTPANSSIDPKTGRKIRHAMVALWKRDSGEEFAEICKGVSGVKFVLGFPKSGGGSKVQSVIFDKGNWTVASAKKWLSDHDFKGLEVDETGESFRFRQEDPDSFERFRTITPGQAKKAADEWDENDLICKAVDGKMQDGVSFPRSDFAYAPDDVPSHWKLRLTSTPGGKPDPGIVGAAIAALGKGFRGKKVQIPTEALSGVKVKVRAAWRAANPDKGDNELPEVLNKGETGMTLDEIEKRVTEQDAQLTVFKAENDALKLENDIVLKMSKKDRKLYASLPMEKRKEFMAADEEKRKAMLAACQKAKDDEGSAAEEAAETAEEEAAEQEKEKARKALVAKVASAEDRVAKAELQLAEISKRERLMHFAKRAEEELPHTAGTADEKGARLMKLADALGGEQSDDFMKTLADLKAADKALAIHYGEVGKAGGTIPAERAWEAKVHEIAKRDNISEGKATAKAMEECPEVYLDYERQHRQFAVQQ
jgi:hypothetical protein